MLGDCDGEGENNSVSLGGDLAYANQSDLSRHGIPTDDLFDIKNRLIDLTSKKKDHRAFGKKFNTSMPLTLDNIEADDSENRETHTV